MDWISISESNSWDTQEQEEQREIADQARQFQKEIEKKYKKSEVNKKFKFPMKKPTLKKCINQNSHMDSKDTSIIDANTYDLNWQVIKSKIQQKFWGAKSDATLLAFLIKQLGKLDLRFLHS